MQLKNTRVAPISIKTKMIRQFVERNNSVSFKLTSPEDCFLRFSVVKYDFYERIQT